MSLKGEIPVKKLSVPLLNDLFNGPQKPVLLLGAGASVPNLPTAANFRYAIGKSLARVIETNTRSSEEIFNKIKCKLDAPHLTLELLFSIIRARLGREVFNPAEFLSEAFKGTNPSTLCHILKDLKKKGLIGPILTTNFDTFLPITLKGLGLRLKTEKQFKENVQSRIPHPLDLIALHGTLYKWEPGLSIKKLPYTPPTTTVARGLAQPLGHETQIYLKNLFRSSPPLIVIGYSGSDHYDINPFFATENLEPLKNSYWFDRDGAPDKNFSQFIRTHCKDRIWHADATKVLGTYCQTRFGTSHSKRQDSNLLYSTTDLENRIFNYLKKLPEPSNINTAIENILQDLTSNLHGAWLSCEHYFLESMGYNQEHIFTFGGIQGQEIKNMNLLSFKNIPFGNLLQLQKKYWDKKNKSHRELTKVFVSFERFNLKIEKKLLSLENKKKGRAEDHAMLKVGQAIALDYMGLASMRLHGKKKAKKYFTYCKRKSKEAEKIVSASFGKDSEISDLIPYLIWEMVAEENYTRCLPRNKKTIERFKEIIRQRKRFAKEGQKNLIASEYGFAHFPQMLLRSQEMLKLIFGVDDNISPPIPWEKLKKTSSLSMDWCKEAKNAMSFCRQAFDGFFKTVTKNNRRFVAYHDATIIYHASRGERVLVENALESLHRNYQEIEPKIQNQVKPWVDQINTRVENCKKVGLI